MSMRSKISSAAGNGDADYAQLQSRVQSLSSLIEVSMIISSTLKLDEVINLVMEKAQTVMRAEASSVMLINEETGMLECEVALGEKGSEAKEKITLALGEGVAGWCAQKGEPVIVPDTRTDPRFAKKFDEETGFQTRSILAVPLIVKDRIIGVAEVINPIEGQSFTDDDLNLFMTFGRQVALAIENARMHESIVEKQRIEQQLEAARTIQESFLPQQCPVCPNNRFQIAAKSIPATAIGGDFYDFFEFDEDTLGVLMGDVAGKGIPAALYMARLVSDFRQQAQVTRDPEKTLVTINDLLVERGRRGMFVTLQYAVLDIPSGCLKMTTAGHLPVVRVRGDGGGCEMLTSEGGAPLGVLPNLHFSTDIITMEPGDYLVYFTDGIIEAKNKKGEQYSFERVTSFLDKKWRRAEEIVDGLIRDIDRFSRDTAQHDDITVVALQWNKPA
ncbi:MAG TPA: GAF domain-containing protein [Bacteroidetes bacterium]|nr:GAF domain-containing protein [Bacteroidota bacterium]